MAEIPGPEAQASAPDPSQPVAEGSQVRRTGVRRVTPRAPGHRRARRRRALRWPLGLLLVLAVLVTGLSWVAASPVGSSPDDDFHLGSIWCPWPLESSDCATRVKDGVVQVQVPERVARSRDCYFFHPEVSAACQTPLSDDDLVYSSRYDDGNYPAGYYRFHHLFVGSDVDTSAIVMRAVNLLIAVAVLGAIGWFMPARLRERYALAITLAWMPMGLYLVTSNNPSSWALTGVLAYMAGIYASVRSTGWRRWVLLALALVGAVLACACRGDSAFYLLVVSLAVFIGLRWRREILVHAAIATVVSLVGASMMLGSGQSQSVATAESSSSLAEGTRLRLIILTVPEYFGGFYGGDRWGAGWFDVPFGGPIAVLALGLAGMAVFIGARKVGLKKALSAGVLAGALIGLPIVLSYAQGFESSYELQPRYVLPLLAPFFLVWLRQPRGEAMATRTQTLLIVGMSALAHAYALHRILLRYTHGLRSFGKDDAGWLPTNLDADPAWWWSIPISPMTVWILGSLMYAMALVCVVLLVRRPGVDGPQESPAGTSLLPADDQTTATGVPRDTEDAGSTGGTMAPAVRESQARQEPVSTS